MYKCGNNFCILNDMPFNPTEKECSNCTSWKEELLSLKLAEILVCNGIITSNQIRDEELIEAVNFYLSNNFRK